MLPLGAARAPFTAAITLLVLGGALAGCRGDELSRVSLTGPGQTSATTWTTSGPTRATVWIDYQGSWTGHEDDPGLTYAVEILEGTATSVQKLTCATSSCRTRVCGSTVSIGNSQTSDCECKTDCTVDLPRAGTFTVRATVDNPQGTFKGTNASLVLRL